METVYYSPKERYEQLEKGVSEMQVKTFLEQFHLSQKQLAELLAVSDKTLYGQRKTGQLDPPLSDRFFLIQSVFAQGVEALMSAAVFRKWLLTPHRSFNGQTPFTLMTTISGAEVVKNELVRTQYGVLS